MALADVPLLDLECPALVEASQQSPTKTDVFEQRAVDAGQTVGVEVRPQIALQRLEDAKLETGRSPLRVGNERQTQQPVFLAFVLEEKSLRNGSQHFLDLVVVLLLAF